MYDLIIRNGRIIDGTGSPWFYGDLAIKEDKIIHIGKLNGLTAKIEIDARNQIVAPGFIDMHVHTDLFILENGLVEAKIRQGITTELFGQDGIAAAPLTDEYVAAWQANLAGLDGTPKIEWDWRTLAEYLNKIEEAGPCFNVAMLAPHGNIRSEVMGMEDRIATDEEIGKMCQILQRCLAEGAVGMSTGLIYTPCQFSNYKELEALCHVLGEYGCPLVIHQRSEGDEILESMDELIEIMLRSKAHLHVSHLKNCGRFNWYKTPELLAKIDSARRRGLEVTFDQYPYNAGSTMLSAILPPWVNDGGVEAMRERLADQELRTRIKKEMATGLAGWDSMSRWADWTGIIVTSVETQANQKYVGLTISEIAEQRKDNPADVALDLIYEEHNAVGMIDIVINEEDIRMICSHPAGTIGSDGLLAGKPHPRAYGTFPRILGRFVRDERITSLEEMIRRMTSQSARICGIQNRGILRAGLKADIVIFNPETIIDQATFDDPTKDNVGIDKVIVNGSVVVDNEKTYNLHKGQVFRRVYFN